MSDEAQVHRSLNTIRTELEYLKDAGILGPHQFDSICAQLPRPNGTKSPYVDPRFAHPNAPNQQGYNYTDVSQQISQHAQDPDHPAHPAHPDHMKWAKSIGGKLGNAAIFGAGATAGSDLVNHIF